MKIYTKKGDRGQTDLIGGKRVSKACARVDAYGTADELNSFIGAARSQSDDGYCDEVLVEVQNHLSNICAELAIVPEREKDIGLPLVTEEQVRWIEKNIDELESKLLPLDNFVLPGGTREASLLHVARAVCRRAERRLVGLGAEEFVRPELIRYFNRLGDLLFVLARHANYRSAVVEIQWKGRKIE